MNRKNISAITLCMYVAAVASLCFFKTDSLPQMPVTWFGLQADKAGHFLMFIPFPILACLTFYTDDMRMSRRFIILATILLIGILMAIGTELIQGLLGYRSAEIEDIYADVAGLAAGGLCVILYTIFTRNR